MMVTSFAARGAIELIPALAVMLGANVGTALIVKALSFDVSWVSPLLLLAGYLSFKHSPKGRYRDLGRVGIGLGLMLLALHMLVETIQPVGTAPLLKNILAALTADPILDMLLAAALTFAAHSSVAVMLLLAGLSAGNVVTPVAAIALVLGANLGGRCHRYWRRGAPTHPIVGYQLATCSSGPLVALLCCRSCIL
jgi:phosphate:Na+ symporter